MSDKLTLKQLVSEAKTAYEKGDYHAAAQDYQAASQGYLEAGDTMASAEMRNNCSVAYLKANQGQASLSAVEGTDAIFDLGGDLRRQGLALGNLGAALEAVGRLQEAAAAYQRSGEVLKEAKEDDLRLYVMRSLSALQLRTGKQLEALATMQSGLEDVQHPSPKQSFLKRLLRAPLKMIGKSNPD